MLCWKTMENFLSQWYQVKRWQKFCTVPFKKVFSNAKKGFKKVFRHFLHPMFLMIVLWMNYEPLADYTCKLVPIMELGLQVLTIKINGSKWNLLNELRLDVWRHKEDLTVISGSQATCLTTALMAYCSINIEPTKINLWVVLLMQCTVTSFRGT